MAFHLGVSPANRGLFLTHKQRFTLVFADAKQRQQSQQLQAGQQKKHLPTLLLISAALPEV